MPDFWPYLFKAKAGVQEFGIVFVHLIQLSKPTLICFSNSRNKRRYSSELYIISTFGASCQCAEENVKVSNEYCTSRGVI